MPAGKKALCYIPWIGLLLFALLCHVSPGLAALLLDRLTRPALLALNRWTARVPFPLVEPIAFAAVAVALAALIWALYRRKAAALVSWLKGLAAAAVVVLWVLALAWLPAMLQPVETPPAPGAAQLEWLCGQLIDGLNSSALDFPEPAEALRLAPETAGLSGCTVKAARYPEWMRGAGISGLFTPPTGEAIVDAGVSPALIPFTAVHELMHLGGIADEGAANIAAWERCLAEGGPFADSARLWALRYALGQLNRADEAAWRRVRGNMKDPLTRVFQACGGEVMPRNRFTLVPSFARIGGDYGDLTGWLAKYSKASPPQREGVAE